MNLNYTIYKYDSGSKTFMTTQSFALPAYDMILTDRNIHTSLILKLEISGDVILQQKDVNLNFLCSDSQSNTMSLSNAVCFKVGIFSIASDDAAFIYTEAERQLNSSSSIKFLNATKSTSINYFLHNYNATNSNLTVYIQIDYDADLIDNFETITNDDFETAINFQSDIYELNLIAGD